MHVVASKAVDAALAARTRFCVLAGGVALAATAVAVAAPVPLAMAVLFLFAGPHNWIEVRYMLARLPSRAGPLASFMLLGGTGVLLLALGTTLMPTVTRPLPIRWLGGASALTLAAIAWNLTLVAWLATMLIVRARQKPVRDWWWVTPCALAIAALTCLQPLAWSLFLVYLHPFMAFWILDRELRARRRELRPVLHALIAAVPVLIAVLWWCLRDAPPLPAMGQDQLTMRILNTAGVGMLTAVPARFLVSSHVLLETLHYAVWLIAIPALALREAPWRITRVPLAVRSIAWRRITQGALALGGCVVVALWAGFSRDYVATRDLYFTIAIVHVLAEAPLLIRLL